ncbi:MAG: hypothetical protein NUV75_00005 [Gallionella sp.]|nr:hypothetical protein [Gallionella sp.]
MIKNKTFFKRAPGWMSALALIVASPLSYAQDPVTVKALAVHSGSNIQYSYQVSNHTSARDIVTVNIGDSGEHAPNSVYDGVNTQPELSVFPVGSYWGQPSGVGDQRYMEPRLGGIFTSPPGWTAKIMLYEETHKFSVYWNIDKSITSNFPVIYPRQTFNFGVTVPTTSAELYYYPLGDPTYLTGHFTVGFNDNEKPGAYTGSIVPIDTTPPILSVTLSPAILWPPNDKLVPVTAAIAVTDDYDPEPEIKLESINASETLAAGDIQDAQFGTDDRSFSLAAKRAGTNQAGRVYTVTYSATDASGNKATASATVTVPHDQGK